MTRNEKELIAVAVSVAAGCEPCTQHHVRAARETGSGDAELRQMTELALSVRERATQRMAAVAQEQLEDPGERPGGACAAPPSRLVALASAACALAANCGAGVPGFLAAAIQAGGTAREGEVALGLARQIKKVAAEKADEAARGEAPGTVPCGCGDATREAASAAPCC